MSYEEMNRVYTVTMNFTCYDTGDDIGTTTTFAVYFRGDYVRHDVDTDRGNKEEYEVEISAEWVDQCSGPNRFRLQEDGTPIKENVDFLLDHYRERAIESMEEEANS